MHSMPLSFIHLSLYKAFTTARSLIEENPQPLSEVHYIMPNSVCVCVCVHVLFSFTARLQPCIKPQHK